MEKWIVLCIYKYTFQNAVLGLIIYRVAQKTKKTSWSLRNYNGACTLSGKISFGALVEQ